MPARCLPRCLYSRQRAKRLERAPKNSKGAPATLLSEIVQYWTAIHPGLANHQSGDKSNRKREKYGAYHLRQRSTRPLQFDRLPWPRSNSSYALLTIVILFVLFFWADLGGLRANLGSMLSGNPNSRVMPVEGPIINPITGIRYVTADNLNMREQPGSDAQVGYILPRGTNVALLGESHQEFDGDVWLKVRVETFEGPYVGWVNQQYVE